MSKFTPGPWEVVPGDEWTTDVGTPDGEYEDGRKRHWNVASVNKRRDEWKANRLLISAAPDLLDACGTLAEWLRHEDEGFDHELHDRNTEEGEYAWRQWWQRNLDLCAEAQSKALAAIAKATGEQP